MIRGTPTTPEDTTSLRQRLEPDCPLLADALPTLLRHQSVSLDAYFQPICVNSQIGQTKANLCCHYLHRDGNGNIRTKDLASFLRREVVNYAIPRSRIREARDHLDKTNSTSKFIELDREATQLFTHLKNTGEGGELLLYVLTESILGLPQLLCKMPLKTSANVHYHGVDGIHGCVDDGTGILALYWGESKLHKSVSSAVTECFTSIAPFLKADGGSSTPESRDIELLRDNIDLDDSNLETAFRKFLDPDDPDHLKLQYRAVCLIGFDLPEYPDPFDPQDKSAITETATQALESWREKIYTSLRDNCLERWTVETFCIPFPSVEAFRDAFLAEMGALHGT